MDVTDVHSCERDAVAPIGPTAAVYELFVMLPYLLMLAPFL